MTRNGVRARIHLVFQNSNVHDVRMVCLFRAYTGSVNLFHFSMLLLLLSHLSVVSLEQFVIA